MRYISGLIAIWALLVSCNSRSDHPGKPVIGVSILPEQYFIERIAGDLAEVLVMIPPGASPATYEPTIGQLGKLSSASAYLRIGYVEFEMSWMEKITAANPDMRIADLSRGIPMIHGNGSENHEHPGHSHSGVDPHIWMSLLNARIIAKNITEELVLQFPDHQDQIVHNLNSLLADIDSLHLQTTEMLAPYQSRGFMIYHPALTYFARDYNLIQYPLEMEGKTPSPAHMKKMVDLGLEEQISAIFIQQQFDRRNAEVLAAEIGADIIQIDPLSAEWFAQMEYIANQLKLSF
jgi:zinc transport system substrate-binding protein